MKSFKSFFIMAIVFAIPFSVCSLESVKLDNEQLQQFRGVTGVWQKVVSPIQYRSYLKKFGCDRETVNHLNYAKYHQGTKYLFFPYSEKYLKELKAQGVSRETVTVKNADFIWPVSKISRISSVLGERWGDFHPGVDFAAVGGTPILAAKAGKVVYSGFAGGYGNCVVIEHNEQIITRYGHQSVAFVKKGEYVAKGQIIGLVGSTGRSTGNHLHFEIRCQNIPLDPLDFLARRDDLTRMFALKNWK